MHVCQDPEKVNTINEAFNDIVTKLKGIDEVSLKHDHTSGILEIATEGHSIDVAGHEIPCFVDTIPEMMTSYIISQILKIVTAAKGQSRKNAVIKAGYNINAKLVLLHAMSDNYYAEQAKQKQKQKQQQTLADQGDKD